MADKRFGVRELIVLGSGTPTITSPGDLNLISNTLGISADVTIGGKIGLGNPVDYGSPNQVLTSNGSSAAPTWEDVSGGVNSFTGLTDTPANYTNSGGKLVAVNSGASALEFIDASTVGGTTYTLPASGNPSAVTVTLTGSDSTTDPVTITAGNNISFHTISAGGFTIASTGGSGGSSDPVGTIVVWAGSAASIPSEYQLCDGSAAQTTELQAITGANVPDLRDKFIVGASDSTGDTTYPGVSPGADGGSKDAIVVSHSHTASTASGGAHNHSIGGNVGFGGNNVQFGSGYAANGGSTSTHAGHQHSVTVNSQGSSGTNANLPPYYALCYIIKHTAGSGSGGGGGTLTDVTVDYTGRSAPCTLPITVSEPTTGTKQINIPSNSNAFGAKYVQNTEPTGNTICDGDIWYDTTPSSGGGGFVTGMIMMFSGTTAPTGWVLCDNSAEAQAANAPDLRDRFIVGTGNSYNLNDTGGSANAVLIAHNHAISPTTVLSTEGLDNTILQGATSGTPLDYGTSTGSNTVGKDNTGANSTSQTGTNANLPPYYALAFIMKT